MQNRRGPPQAVFEEEKQIISDGEDDFNQVFGHALSSNFGNLQPRRAAPPQRSQMSSLLDTSLAQRLNVAFLNSQGPFSLPQVPGAIPDDENQLQPRQESGDEEYPDF